MDAKVLVCCIIGPAKQYCQPFLASALSNLGGQDIYTVLDGAEWSAEGLPGDVEQLSEDVWQTVPPGLYGRQARMRNAARAHFLSGDWTHLYFHDPDMIPPSGILAALLAQDAPMVTGLYNTRTRDTLAIPMLPAEPILRDTPFPADAFGFGCVLLRRDAVEAAGFRADGCENGEDYSFCQDVAAKGIGRLLIDPSQSCWHVRAEGFANRIAVSASADGACWMDQPHYITNRFGIWEKGVPRFDLSAEQLAMLPPGFERNNYVRLSVEVKPLSEILGGH